MTRYYITEGDMEHLKGIYKNESRALEMLSETYGTYQPYQELSGSLRIWPSTLAKMGESRGRLLAGWPLILKSCGHFPPKFLKSGQKGGQSAHL